MAHKDWCGKPCSECLSPCPLDESMRCSPDCDGLHEDGTRDAKECTKSGCDAFGSTQGECPVCGYDDLTYGDSFLQDESYIYRWSCEKCGASGKEAFSLEFVCHFMD